MENILSIAPMVDKTDRHFRNFIRMISDKPTLYTEMITAKAIINGNLDYILGFDEIEHPVVLQIAATNKEEAYQAVKMAEKYNYDEINLNVGCPSDKVSGNMMGAYLMAFPELVYDIILEMKKATNKSITVKHRIGIDGKNILPDYFDRTLFDKYEDMERFVKIVSESGVKKFIVHARIAILEGLDPKQNREIPPIRYEDIYRLKKENPNLTIEINGGIKTFEDAKKHLEHVDSIMIGREIYDNPMILVELDELYGVKNNIERKDIVEKMLIYVEAMEKRSERPHSFLMHTQGLFYAQKGSKFWKRLINDPKADSNTLKEILKLLS